jgi:pimeloyl-ACP methyl ester carboxylesterase
MENDVDIEGLNIHYSVTGPDEGAPILLMHGWGCNHTTLASIERLLNTHMRVVNIDFPGHGKSAEPPVVWGIEDYTRLTEKFIAKVCPTVKILLGHSFGGRVGLLYSSRHDVDKLLLVDAAGVKPRRPLKYYIKVYSFKTMKHLMRLVYGRSRAEEKLNAIRAKKGSADYAASSPIMRGVLSKVVNEDLKHVMPAIHASTLLIWGENDTATPLQDAKTMERLIPDAGLVSFPGCGHYSFLDNPRGFAAVVKEFLKKELS